MDLWDGLVAAALVGTERRPWQPEAGEGALGDLMPCVEFADPGGSLLGAAGAVALHRKAGRLGLVDRRQAPEPAPIEDLPPVVWRAGRRLGAMLAGQHRDVLPEWLSLVSASGQRAPDASLPALLEHGRDHEDLRDPILSVVGGRGRWLAAQNPDWEWAAEVGEVEQVWQTAGRERRLTLLRKLRREAPAHARALLAASWAEEEPADRAAFLATFELGLSMDDEPCLEDALDDRRKEVRSAAVGLLARLPESRLVQRMIERVRPLLSFVPAETGSLLSMTRGKPARIEVTLPSQCDSAMARDGVELKPTPNSRLGERAWWLAQMLGLVPPSAWVGRWGVTPPVLLEASSRGEWGEPLLQGWRWAAARHRDGTWAEALVRRDPGCTELLAALPTGQADDLLASTLERERDPFKAGSPLVDLVNAFQRGWSLNLSRLVLRHVRNQANHGASGRPGWYFNAVLRNLALYAPVPLADEVAKGWPPEPDNPWTSAVNELLDTLRFRAEMHKEIAE